MMVMAATASQRPLKHIITVPKRPREPMAAARLAPLLIAAAGRSVAAAGGASLMGGAPENREV
jgi:hypothetical protein